MPSEIPNVIEMQKKSSWQTLEARVSTVQCPVGKVPIRRHEAIVDDRIYPKTGGNMTFTPKHEYAEAYTNAGHKLYGTKATINVWDPMVEDRENEASISQIWLTSGDFETNDLNTIEVGWQVCPGLYNDSKPRLFVYWTGDGYKTSGGYNLQKPGFIQTSNNIVLGGAISPISSFGGTQYEITILVWKDSKMINWWLSLGSDNSIVGYWPAEIFTSLADHASTVDWGGEIVDSHKFGRHTKTQMGSGHFPEEGFKKASYFRNLEFVDNNNSLQKIQQFRLVAEGIYYKIKNLHTDEWGTHFFYGGPGFSHMHSGISSRYGSYRDRIVVLHGGWSLFEKGTAGEILLRLTYKAYVEEEEDEKTNVKAINAYASDDEMPDSEELGSFVRNENFQGIVSSEAGDSPDDPVSFKAGLDSRSQLEDPSIGSESNTGVSDSENIGSGSGDDGGISRLDVL
ncbi:uncharacterized protein LOC18010864 [Eutrema salsugineum]|uniref:uncharacterized protein LOC18010864 n=1 Tax=Eutrema salsugineum TaxID=72664 RepID=UPI000CECFCE7|nr:uncharacterized protein LOC18010864 [Eutrema salsugineum]